MKILCAGLSSCKQNERRILYSEVSSCWYEEFICKSVTKFKLVKLIKCPIYSEFMFNIIVIARIWFTHSSFSTLFWSFYFCNWYQNRRLINTNIRHLYCHIVGVTRWSHCKGYVRRRQHVHMLKVSEKGQGWKEVMIAFMIKTN